MPGHQWITHNGVKILIIELACPDLASLEKVVNAAAPAIQAEPEGSVRCLASTEGGHFNITMTRTLKDFVAANRPYILKTALLGVKGLQLTIFNSILTVTGRTNMVLKKSRQEALDYLAEG